MDRIRLPDAWLGPVPPEAEQMAREAGYAEDGALWRAFCTGVDTERLRQSQASKARPSSEPGARCPHCGSEHTEDAPPRQQYSRLCSVCRWGFSPV